jgi:exopolyphosphatase/guanosine-5'-triphosphate,3'-diphosphate pyrophosphatase
MPTVRRAVIDVGTNSVKLLIADVAERDVRPVQEESRQTRLGRDFYATHRLQPAAVARTAEAVAEFVRRAREKNSTRIRVVATSAARDAVNPADLIIAIEHASGLKTEIITGAREADWVFRGVATDAALARLPLLLIEVGGGSTEFILGLGRDPIFAHSFPLGTVRLMEKFPHGDPPTDAEFQIGCDWVRHLLQAEVRPLLEPTLPPGKKISEVRLVGTGGTTSILARIEKKLNRFDRDQIDGTVLNFEQVVAQRKNLWRLPLAARREIPGLPKLHADVILPGILIYEAVMAEFGFQQLRVSTRGLRFAAVMEEDAKAE